MTQDNRIFKIFSSLILLISHPVIIASFATYTIFNSQTVYSLFNDDIKNYVYYVIVGITAITPVIIYVVAPLLKRLYSTDFSERNKRLFPIILSLIVHYYAYHILKEHRILYIINLFLLSVVVSNIIILIIAFFSTASLHLNMLGSIIALYLHFDVNASGLPIGGLMLIILLSAIVASTQLATQKQSPLSIYPSFVIGFFSTYFFLFTT